MPRSRQSLARQQRERDPDNDIAIDFTVDGLPYAFSYDLMEGVHELELYQQAHLTFTDCVVGLQSAKPAAFAIAGIMFLAVKQGDDEKRKRKANFPALLAKVDRPDVDFEVLSQDEDDEDETVSVGSPPETSGAPLGAINPSSPTGSESSPGTSTD